MPRTWIFTLVLVSSLSLFAEHNAQPKSEKQKSKDAPKVEASIQALFSPKSTPAGDRRIFVYSKTPLTNVEYKVPGGSGKWIAMPKGVVIDNDKLHAYLASEYLPTDANKKYYVRGTREDGSRFTDILTAQDPGEHPEYAVDVAGHLNETKADLEKALAAERAKGYKGTLEYAQSYIGKTAPAKLIAPGLIGDGCLAFGKGGEEIGRVTQGGRVTGSILPGAIVHMQNWRVRATDGFTYSSPPRDPQHYGVVESYDPATQQLTVIHQNPGVARRVTFELNSLSGTFTIRAGDH